jgi:hypothetical protein
MIKLQLINADIIDDTDTVMSRLFRKSFNCRYNPRMEYVFCLPTLKSSEKWWSPLFGATCNFNWSPYSKEKFSYFRTSGWNVKQGSLANEQYSIIPQRPYSLQVFCAFSNAWWSPLFGATCNFNEQILPYGILFLAFINTDVFYLLSFKFSR